MRANKRSLQKSQRRIRALKMPLTGPLDLFSLDNDPDVIEARESVHAARRAMRRAPYGQKRRKEKLLRAAVIKSLRLEISAEKKFKERS